MNSRILKTLFYLPLDDRTHISGPVADALNIARSFAYAQIPSIFIFNGQPEIFRLFEETGIDVRRVEMPVSSLKSHFNSVYRRRFSRRLADFIRQEKIELLYLLDNAPYLLNYVKNLDILKVCTEIGGSPDPRPIGLFDRGVRLHPKHLAKAWYRKYVRLNYRSADLVICISKAARGTALITYGIDRERVVVVRPGVTGRLSDSKRGAIRREFGIGADEKIVLSVGRITAEKGVEDFGEVARTVVSREKGYRFLFVGVERDESYGRMIRQKYGECVMFLGQRSDIANVYADADLLVHLSHREGSPLVVIEALEFGLPCVAWGIPGTSEDVVDGITGRTVPFGDRATAAHAIQHIFEQPGEIERLGAGALERFDQFSVDDYAPRIMRAVQDRMQVLAGS